MVAPTGASQGIGASAIAAAAGISRASVYRVLAQAEAAQHPQLHCNALPSGMSTICIDPPQASSCSSA
ncbi:helix-turn-helix domain-containing protein [Sphingobium fontiphilum]|uniref:helix-turn-helix domain-containing protein n=1 Tax=Sphingobium fontiphilum TaxID=944425 RepID=UPI003CCE5422